MYFDSWSAFWDMGGYGFFVWLSFGVTILSMAMLVVESMFAKRTLLVKIALEQSRKKRIEANKQSQKKVNTHNQVIESE
jgi:heme exporter protein D